MLAYAEKAELKANQPIIREALRGPQPISPEATLALYQLIHYKEPAKPFQMPPNEKYDFTSSTKNLIQYYLGLGYLENAFGEQNNDKAQQAISDNLDQAKELIIKGQCDLADLAQFRNLMIEALNQSELLKPRSVGQDFHLALKESPMGADQNCKGIFSDILTTSSAENIFQHVERIEKFERSDGFDLTLDRELLSTQLKHLGQDYIEELDPAILESFKEGRPKLEP